MAVDDKYQILNDEDGSYYIYIDRRGVKWKTRVRETKCLTCGRTMYQIIRNGEGVQRHCSYKCRPIRRGFKQDRARMNLSGLRKGRGWNKGMRGHLSAETLQKMSDARKGKYGAQSPNWKGGTKSEDKRIRARIEYAEWRIAIFERGEYTCQHCGKIGGELNAHHIKSFKHHPELRTDLSNGVTLCVPCHRKEHKRLKDFVEVQNG